MSFSIDWIPLVFAVILTFLMIGFLYRTRLYPIPHWKFSDLTNLKVAKESWKVWLVSLPKWLLWVSWVLLLLAFVDPHLFIEKPLNPAQKQILQNPTEGIAIYLVLDQSGSMKEKISRKQSKIELLKEVTAKFVKDRPNDLIGLVEFARGAKVLAPLTLDHQTILKQLSDLNIVQNMDQDGTAIGYAIYKTASLIASTRHYAEELIAKGEPSYKIKNSVIILVTDGMQDPNPKDKGKRLRNIDIPEAALYAKEQGVRLYAIVIEPKLLTEEYAPYRNMMKRVTEMTGGKFFMMDVSNNLSEIYQEIDKLEKSTLPKTSENLEKFSRVNLYPYFIAISLICLFAYVWIEAFVLRKAP